MSRPTLKDIVAQYKHDTVRLLTESTDHVFSSGDLNLIQEYEVLAEGIRKFVTDGSVTTDITDRLHQLNLQIANPSTPQIQKQGTVESSRNGKYLSIDQATRKWQAYDAEHGNPIITAEKGYKLRIYRLVRDGKIDVKKNGAKIAGLNEKDFEEQMKSYRGARPRAEYIPFEQAWKLMRQAEFDSPNIAQYPTGNGAYGNRIKQYVKSGRLPAQSTGKDLKVHRPTLMKIIEERISSGGKKLSPHSSKDTGRYDEIIKVMQSQQVSFVQAMDMLCIAGLSRSGYLLAHRKKLKECRVDEK